MKPSGIEGTYLGTLANIDRFIELWRENLTSMAREGGEALPTQRTLDFFRTLYLSTHQLGTAVFGAEGNAIYFWTPINLPWDTKWLRPAMGHGAYVRPAWRRQGWATRVRQRGIEEMRKQGIETLLGGWYHENVAEHAINEQFGYRPYHTSTAIVLKEL